MISSSLRKTRFKYIVTFAKRVFPAVATVGFLWLLIDRLADIDRTAIFVAFAQVTTLQWVGAALATCISYWAVGQYDSTIHRMLNTRYRIRDTQRSGIAAIAIAQSVGFGALTGAFVRWRLLGDSSLAQATRISATVAVSFLGGWAIFVALLILASDVAPQFWPMALTTLIFTGAAVFACLGLRGISVFGRRWHLPSLRAMRTILLLSVIDMTAAAAALYLLLPADVAIPFLALLGAYSLSLGAGLISNTPGGVGPFELSMLAFLPFIPPEAILSAILAYRLIYYIVPALLAVAYVLTTRPVCSLSQGYEISPGGDGHSQALMAAKRAEMQLVRQGDGFILGDARLNQRLVCHQSAQCTVMMGDPVSGDCETALVLLQRKARDRMTTPIAYKIGADMAAAATVLGWAQTPISLEGRINPANFDISTSSFRQLRRKLRKSEKARVTVQASTAGVPWAQMQAISKDWAARNGGERGLSTGRFEQDYIAQQRLYLAHANGALVGFITLHISASEWTLDLIRTAQNAPDGTTHSLVTKAIQDAHEREIARLSLAAVPYDGPTPAWQAPLRRRHINSARGLRQFKACFNPDWEVLYATAPAHSSLLHGLFDIARDVRYPAALRN